MPEAMPGLMVDVGGKRATFAEVMEADKRGPKHTHSHRPVSYRDTIDMVESEARYHGLEIDDRGFALGAKGMQIFALWRFLAPDSRHGMAPSFALHNSLNKTLSLKGVGGATQPVSICTNLCIFGGDVRAVRKNTVNVYRDVRVKLREVFAQLGDSFERANRTADVLSVRRITQVESFRIAGEAAGARVLPTQGINAVFDQIRNPPEVFDKGTQWCLYNHFTEGAKRGAPGAYVDRAVNVDRFFRERLGLNPC